MGASSITGPSEESRTRSPPAPATSSSPAAQTPTVGIIFWRVLAQSTLFYLKEFLFGQKSMFWHPVVFFSAGAVWSRLEVSDRSGGRWNFSGIEWRRWWTIDHSTNRTTHTNVPSIFCNPVFHERHLLNIAFPVPVFRSGSGFRGLLVPDSESGSRGK